ncbi:MAG TPA: amidase [Gaiellaceae bacterium]|jgi:aspartyl-tRNA(Asn)/glutamyl-tRNA(Gln) amidotransferase subunit A
MDGIWITELDGAPAGRRLAVKDLFDTAGVRTTYGSAVFADHVPAETAPAVRLLEAAGWVSVGKANLHEFAYGVTSQNLHYGTVPNPRAPARTAGGSSGGSAAALVAGLADGALGTDSGGSIRIPAACCGTVGFKPTYGLVPLEGVFPLAPSYDHVGPLGRDVATCVELTGVLAPGLERLELALGDVSVAVAWTEHADPHVRARVEEAAALFPHRRAVDFPEPHGTHDVFMREVGDVHRDLYAENAELYGENIRSKIELCIGVSDREAARAAATRAEYEERAEQALGDADLLLTPTLMFVAPPADIDEVARRVEFIRFTYGFNALGWPALALPCGPAEDGLPASLQIVGRKGADALVLAAAAAVEAALKT